MWSSGVVSSADKETSRNDFLLPVISLYGKNPVEMWRSLLLFTKPSQKYMSSSINFPLQWTENKFGKNLCWRSTRFWVCLCAVGCKKHFQENQHSDDFLCVVCSELGFMIWLRNWSRKPTGVVRVWADQLRGMEVLPCHEIEYRTWIRRGALHFCIKVGYSSATFYKEL